jgi:hypothetical protein
MRLFLRSLFCVSWLIGYTAGIMFEAPDGRLNDFEETFTLGDTLGIKWKAGWEGSDEQPDFVDLFVTWYQSDSYSQLLIGECSLAAIRHVIRALLI